MSVLWEVAIQRELRYLKLYKLDRMRCLPSGRSALRGRGVSAKGFTCLCLRSAIRFFRASD
ncbi:hypothetical protein MPC4_30122 [Methylocella tundrae]|uniref:Uncharacterized protein n=1 Tax=Methylocella tundrae TaxID=227605 RepID=A0A8B6M848_METTU|nr:hypothetical protein MPC1_13630002 [Methylocella tundrae]VTZ50938.1 hypothetical protein MPC4_30122 [Methylocella tundrae]